VGRHRHVTVRHVVGDQRNSLLARPPGAGSQHRSGASSAPRSRRRRPPGDCDIGAHTDRSRARDGARCYAGPRLCVGDLPRGVRAGQLLARLEHRRPPRTLAGTPRRQRLRAVERSRTWRRLLDDALQFVESNR
jgi:hypothetical protein